MIKAAVFDCDGVLVDTEGLQWQSWVEALKPFKVTVSKEQYLTYAGKRGDIIEDEIIRDYSLDVKKGSLLEEKETIVVRYFNEKELEKMFFALEAVHFFQNQKMKLACVSGSTRAELLIKFKQGGFENLFPVIVAGDEVERGKPFPDMYLKASELLNEKAEDCVVFEDTQYGVESAIAAGMKCIAIPNQYSLQQDFSKATIVVSNLKEAVDWCKAHIAD